MREYKVYCHEILDTRTILSPTPQDAAEDWAVLMGNRGRRPTFGEWRVRVTDTEGTTHVFDISSYTDYFVTRVENPEGILDDPDEEMA